MFLRSAIRYASFFYIFKLVIEKALSGKIRFLSVFIEKNTLLTLIQNDKFQSLLFSSDYDGIPVIKDKVTLLGYILEDTADKQMKRQPLEPLDKKGKLFNNDKNYSRYEIKKEDLQNLLESYGTEVHYFIFKPVDYVLDKEYVAYQIIPADRNKVPLGRRQTESGASRRMMNIQSPEAEQSDVQTYSHIMEFSTMRQEYEVAGTMNPSPPATSNFEVQY